MHCISTDWKKIKLLLNLKTVKINTKWRCLFVSLVFSSELLLCFLYTFILRSQISGSFECTSNLVRHNKKCCSNLMCIEVTYKCCEIDQGLNMQFCILTSSKMMRMLLIPSKFMRSLYTKGLILKEMTIFVNHPSEAVARSI